MGPCLGFLGPHSNRESVMARMGIEAQGKQRGTKFITIVELERRQSKAKQQAKEKKVAKQASQKKAKAEQMANAKMQMFDAEAAKVAAATAAAKTMKFTLLGMFCKLRGSWAARAKAQLEQVVGLLEAVKMLQCALRKQVSRESE